MQREDNRSPTALAAEPLDSGTIEALLVEQAELCHKINNPLTTVMGRAQILQLKCGENAQVAGAAKLIEESARQVAALVRELSHKIHAIRGGLPGE